MHLILIIPHIAWDDAVICRLQVARLNELANENERLRKKLRDLEATLSESAANGGTWPV